MIKISSRGGMAMVKWYLDASTHNRKWSTIGHNRQARVTKRHNAADVCGRVWAGCVRTQ